MHCVAGDGVGILIGALLSVYWTSQAWPRLFSNTFWVRLWLDDFPSAIHETYGGRIIPTSAEEHVHLGTLSMNLLMAGMVPTVMTLKSAIPAAADPTAPSFWFVMSMSLLVG